MHVLRALRIYVHQPKKHINFVVKLLYIASYQHNFLKQVKMAILVDENRFRKIYGSYRTEPQIRSAAAGSSVEYTFPSDLTVSLPNGKTFGRYENGDIIPSTGKTTSEVIQMALIEPLEPTVTLTSSTVIEFNQTAISNSINFGHVINSLGGSASVDTAVLAWRRGGSGSWTTLTDDSAATTYTHTLTDSPFNTASFNYRYTVTDTTGGTNNIEIAITPNSYVYPTATLVTTITAASGIIGETNSKREAGNISSTLTGVITRTNPYVALASYTVEYSIDGADYVAVPGLSGVSVTGNPTSVNIAQTLHSDTSPKPTGYLRYRVYVTDAYTAAPRGGAIIEFYNVIFYGPVGGAPGDSAAVRSLPTKIFTTPTGAFTLTLNTGTVFSVFSIALPAAYSLASVVDLDSLNANITSAYTLSTFNINDAGGTSTTYKVYTMTAGIPYSSSHRHQITIT